MVQPVAAVSGSVETWRVRFWIAWRSQCEERNERAGGWTVVTQARGNGGMGRRGRGGERGGMVSRCTFVHYSCFGSSLGFCLRVVMGSLQQALGQAFNGMSMGRPWKAQRTGWASSRSGSSCSLSGAEPSSVASAAETDASLTSVTHRTGSGLSADTDASLSEVLTQRSGSGSPADTGGRLTSLSQRWLRGRRGFALKEQIDFGDKCMKFRDAFAKEHSRLRGWRTAFLQGELHIVDCKSQVAKLALNQVRAAVQTAEKGTEKQQPKRGAAVLGCYRSSVVDRARKRRRGGGRKPSCPIIGEHLWWWFVERLRTVPGRVGTQLLCDQANVIAADIYDEWLQRSADGHGDGSVQPQLPEINRQWVDRWRRAYGVTFRTVNLRYKISHSKRVHRLRIFWSNVLRVRLLHECLFGRDGIDFVSMDQKPLYFNSCLAMRTLAPRGAAKVNVKESVASSRERFTIMTSCVSWTVSVPPGIAILFRHGGQRTRG